jgi:hypothetical protein
MLLLHLCRRSCNAPVNCRCEVCTKVDNYARLKVMLHFRSAAFSYYLKWISVGQDSNFNFDCLIWASWKDNKSKT